MATINLLSRLMKTILHTTLFTLAFLITAPLRADEVGELLNKLQIQTAKSIEMLRDDKGRDRSDLDRIYNDLLRLQNDLAPDTFDGANAQRMLSQLATSKLSPEARAIVSKISILLPGLTEANEKNAAIRINAALEKAAAACLSAKKESDLDVVLIELNARRQRSPDRPASTLRLREGSKLDDSIRFVGRWQDYLAKAAGGYTLAANKLLHELADNPSPFPLLTHSQILTKLGPPELKPESPDVPLRAVKNLDDLPPVIAQLSSRATEMSYMVSGSVSDELLAVLNDLKMIEKGHLAFKSGAYSQSLQVVSHRTGWGGRVSSLEANRLRGLLLAEVLPHCREVPGNEEMKPGENPSQFLLRLADEATAKGDWDMVQRTLGTYHLVAFEVKAPAWLQGEITACAAFLAGQNLEKAGQFSSAVRSYQSVLKQAGKRVPTKEAGDRLAAIQKDHPEAFTAAMKEAEIRDLIESIGRLGLRPVTAP